MNAYYSEQGKSTRLREKKTDISGVWYIIIDCAQLRDGGRKTPGSDLWLRC